MDGEPERGTGGAGDKTGTGNETRTDNRHSRLSVERREIRQ